MREKYDYRKLLDTAYELEGLLLLQDKRSEGPSEDIDRLIAEKISSLYYMAQSDECPVSEATAQCEETKEDLQAVAQSALTEEALMADEPTEPKESEFSTQIEETPAATVVNDVVETPVSVEEKLARERAKDIYGAFTINDKFRFRRELFHNSQEEFAEALDVISQMSTVEEAEEYVYDDLCLNADNEDVKAFMEVVAKHF